MTVGFAMMVHADLDRAAQVARHWASAGCPVVIHVDQRVSRQEYAKFGQDLAGLDNVSFCTRHKCEWGRWSLVAAAQSASEQLLEKHAEVTHVYLASGSCLPLRPVSELVEYLAARPRTDFIESATTDDVPWTVGGLDRERFTLRFPFSWKRQRRLFDRYVALQRRVGFRRRIPPGLVPHLGSQWWCLTRRTLSAILEDPERPVYDRYFKKVWIPDESYFQTLARQYSSEIESRSLTLSKFDFQGKPHIFYDDHLQLLRRSDCFVARKIWPRAEKLYRSFLTDAAGAMKKTEPNPGKIDRIFSQALQRRTRGRSGLWMQSRYPNEGWENGKTSGPYTVLEGFDDLFEDFLPWLSKAADVKVHGHIFAKERAEFAGGQTHFAGGLSDGAKLRDYHCHGFLRNLIWNTRGERQCFQFGPTDLQDISWHMSTDANANIYVVTGAWAVRLFLSNLNFAEIRKEAARLQKIEAKHLDVLRSPHSKARIKIWTMADFVQAPMEPLQMILDATAAGSLRRLQEAPKMRDLTGFAQFLQNLKNQGMHPYLMGDFSSEFEPQPVNTGRRRPYVVK